MEISFESKRLEKILTDERLIKKHYAHVYKPLKIRLSELLAVSNLSLITNLPPPRRHKLSGDYEECWAVDLSKNYRLVFRPIKNQIGCEPYEITKIVIIKIIDYHGR